MGRHGGRWAKATESDVRLRGASRKVLFYEAYSVEPLFSPSPPLFWTGGMPGVLRTQIASFYHGKGIYVSRVDLNESACG